MLTHFHKLELLFFIFSQYKTITLLFCSTLAFLQSLGLWPRACKLAGTVEETGVIILLQKKHVLVKAG